MQAHEGEYFLIYRVCLQERRRNHLREVVKLYSALQLQTNKQTNNVIFFKKNESIQAALEVSFALLSFLDLDGVVADFEKALATALQHCFNASWQSL